MSRSTEAVTQKKGNLLDLYERFNKVTAVAAFVGGVALTAAGVAGAEILFAVAAFDTAQVLAARGFRNWRARQKQQKQIASLKPAST